MPSTGYSPQGKCCESIINSCSKILNYVHPNDSQENTHENCYKVMVRPIVEYACTHAARFVNNNYSSFSSVTAGFRIAHTRREKIGRIIIYSCCLKFK